MNILLHPDLILEYINCNEKISPSQEQLLLLNLFKNDSNKVLYSSEWEEYYIKYFTDSDSEKYDLLDIWNSLFIDLYDTDRLVN